MKQGDPLSPCLFIIGAEVLSRGLNDLVLTKKTEAFSKPIHCLVISHLAFADDHLYKVFFAATYWLSWFV